MHSFHQFFLAIVAGMLTISLAQAQPPNLAGSWTGFWESDMNGHHGPLRARLRQRPDGSYRALFSGRYAGIIPFWYTARLNVEGVGEDVLLLEGSQRLPLLGDYRTQAVVTATDFNASFTSRRDYGRFVLQRRR
ncbi:MAG TPA: hypothetical protein PKA06_04205 [Gemmatales bacterium]|nr:hypothetical protein [Gemmatales bacterium]HMP17416.1 hypothetical protein [Gemmatales bacterium]